MSTPLRVLVTGGNGQLGRDVRDVLAGLVPVGGLSSSELEGTPFEAVVPGTHEVLATDIDTLDLVDRAAVRDAVEGFRPDLILHGGAYTAVDACESDPDTAFAVNSMGTRHMAEAAVAVGAHIVYVSTDYVFDGTSPVPYVEWDAPAPRSVYGRSKLGGELEIRALAGASGTIVRTAWVSGAHGANMVKTVQRVAAASPDGVLRFVDDQHGCPTFTADLARAIVRLGTDRRPGTFHVTNQGETSWFGFVKEVMATTGHDPARVQPIATSDLDPPRPAPRPANSRLDNAGLRLSGLPAMPRWQDALARLVAVLPEPG
ncbi:MAG TPA: dTDP-4-dehydrorhamnose reductase [Acidimicrobiales bacterium]